MINLRTLKWEIILDNAGGSIVITESLEVEDGGGSDVRKSDVIVEAESERLCRWLEEG